MENRIFKRVDIDRAFTEVINKYFVNGYVAHTATMGGTQGEVGKIDVTNDGGKTVYRIMLYKDYAKKLNDDDKYGHERAMIVEVRKYVRGVDFHHDTIWNDRGEGIEYYEWYEVDDEKVFTNNRNFLREIKAKRFGRYRRWYRDFNDIANRALNNATITDKLMTYINNTKGFKAVKKRDIKNVWRDGKRYFVEFKNREGRYTVYNG